jgi:hypothetical protein
VLLNGRPFDQRLVLDQGYWPQTGMTPPDLAAIERDVELVKALGFNGVRKHQKIEDPRFLRVADERGLLVWEELPSAYRVTARSAERLTRQWLEVLERDLSHPCIVAWVPFNESWGVPTLAVSAPQRDLVRALVHLTRALDPDRLVIGNDGWETIAGDVVGAHDYERVPARLRERLGQVEAELFHHQRFYGHLLMLDGDTRGDRPLLLTEFGGIAFQPADEAGGRSWGYDRAGSSEELLARYEALLEAVHDSSLAGFCYTQLTDTYQETNGLLTADRRPKAPVERLAVATIGDPDPTYEELAPEGGTVLVDRPGSLEP